MCRALRKIVFTLAGLILLFAQTPSSAQMPERPRAREAGIRPGVLAPGALNAITDVPGVRVGHVTIVRGDSIRTGVTAILPHGGNLYMDKVPAGIAVGNGFGKLMGVTQVRELGEIETPIVLTNTLSVPRAADAIISYTLERNEDARSVNAIVGETNDGFLNDIRARVIMPEHVLEAIESAAGGAVEEGNVGAGTGTIAFGWKGGIGTSSRHLPESLGGFTVGVLVQTNYGGVLRIMGQPVGKDIGRYYLEGDVDSEAGDGSVMIVIATDAPVSDRNLERMARRAFLGIGRTGSPMTNGSGDYAIAFSTAEEVRRTPERRSEASTYTILPNDRMSPLFEAVVEATEEAVYNSLFKAETMKGHRGTVEALPLEGIRSKE
ncbi:MAG: P1 family peptidase [Rhodothermales bacterium]